MTVASQYLTSTPNDDMHRPLEVGDVYVVTWGYDQTNIDFYQCVGITPSGKSVRVRPIGAMYVGGSGHTDYLVPVRDDFIGDTETRRIQRWDVYECDPAFRVTSFSNAYRTAWNVRHGQTAAGYGH